MADVLTHPTDSAHPETLHPAIRQATLALQVGFVVAPIVAGLDEFSMRLTDWEAYLAPVFSNALGASVHGAMRAIGLVEVTAGLLVALRPRIGGYVVSAWLLGIIFNLLLTGKYFDIALRDVGLSLAAFALARLATYAEQTHSENR